MGFPVLPAHVCCPAWFKFFISVDKIHDPIHTSQKTACLPHTSVHIRFGCRIPLDHNSSASQRPYTLRCILCLFSSAVTVDRNICPLLRQYPADRYTHSSCGTKHYDFSAVQSTFHLHPSSLLIHIAQTKDSLNNIDNNKRYQYKNC